MHRLGLWLCFSILSACATRTAEPEAAAPRPQSTQGSEVPEIAALRPAGADAALAPLEVAPRDPGALARAATFYASTDAPGMTLLYGLTYGATGADGPEHAELARAMTTVLRERVVMDTDGHAYHLIVRLAPGAVPLVVDPDGTRWAPVAHLFEQRMMPALIAFHGGDWHLSDVAAVITSLAEVPRVTGPLPLRVLETPVTMLGWLRELAAAGHVAAFASWLFGPAFAEDDATYRAANGPAIAAMRAYVAAHPLVPTRVMPDDLVELR